MRESLVFVIPVLLAGCATAGSYPTNTGDPGAASTAAARQIALATDAGADSLAPEVLADANRLLAAAQQEAQAGHASRAAISAQQAAASAVYAKAQADRVLAERDKAQALAAMQALPPQEP
jgi:hypothetical protein